MIDETQLPEAPPPPPREPEWGFLDLLFFFGLAVPFFILGIGGTYGLLTLVGLPPSELRMLLSQFGGYALAIVPLYIVFGRKFDVPPMRLFRMGVPGNKTSASFAAGIVASFAVLAMAAALRMPKIETPMEKLLEDPVILATAAVLGVSIGPWFEELVFRGLLQPVLVRTTGVIPGIVLAALPFAMLHGPQYGWSWRHVVLLTLAGCSFGGWRQRTNSTGAAILMHAGYNMVLFAGFIAAKWVGSDLQTI